ncbi:MAG: hypothetical protein ACFCUR_03455 [Rhodomicrobiaceae bacterium]
MTAFGITGGEAAIESLLKIAQLLLIPSDDSRMQGDRLDRLFGLLQRFDEGEPFLMSFGGTRTEDGRIADSLGDAIDQPVDLPLQSIDTLLQRLVLPG